MRLSHHKAPGELQVKLLENTLINIGLVRLSPWEWPKCDCGTKNSYKKQKGLKWEPSDSNCNV